MGRFCKFCGVEHVIEEMAIAKNGVRYCRASKQNQGRYIQSIYRKMLDDPEYNESQRQLRRDVFRQTHERRKVDAELNARFYRGFTTSGPIKGKAWKRKSEQRKVDSVVAEQHRQSSRKGALMLQKRRQEDSEFDAMIRHKVGIPQRKYRASLIKMYEDMKDVESLRTHKMRIRKITNAYYQKMGLSRRAIFESVRQYNYDDKCYLCSKVLGDGPIEVDHVLPLISTLGASDAYIEKVISLENLKVVHQMCNTIKGGLSVELAQAKIQEKYNECSR